MTAPLTLTREQVIAHRLRANELVERLRWTRASLRRAAWAGLTDSVPRAALLSLHARVADTPPGALDDEALVGIWGPRFSAYIVAAKDRAPFTLGRLPDNARRVAEIVSITDRLAAFLGQRRMSYADAGHAMGVPPNSLRYATLTGRVLIRWEGAGRPEIRMVEPPDMSPADAGLELARRHLHVLGPSTATSFGDWAGIGTPRARGILGALGPELVAVRMPSGDGSILASDEASFRDAPDPRDLVSPTAIRLLPSGDAWWLHHGGDRELLVPNDERRAELWPTRVWPGALLVGHEIAGTWRRAEADIEITPWRRLAPAERDAVETEARSLPLPGLAAPLRIRWSAVPGR
jgi:hypothetical protein